MHGRIKVRTTAEQAEAKRKEREKKLKIYNQTTGRLFEKRKNGELDTEALSLSEQILASNPDFSTLWNFRREIFQKMKDEFNPTELLQNTCLRELSFLKTCLQVNPKSYSVWHHREWIMEFMPQPNWKEELHLCNLFLSFDERNFHCWDYRRYAVKKAKESAEDEFNFSTAKIKENFSNYSSWHYRSKLLPLIHPDPSGDKERVEEQALMKEFDLAQNAFFTDPYDQSAWFYHRWLLGRARPRLDISCFYVKRWENSLSIVLQFNQPFQIPKECPVVSVDEHEVNGEWCNPFHNNHPSKVWSLCASSTALNFANDVTFSVKFAKGNLERSVVLAASESETWSVTSDSHLFRAELTAVQSSVLQKELDSCRLLLEEEPDNKWTMLTMVLLMRAVDPLLYEKETNSYLEKLTSVDRYRQEYYKDLGRKFKLENLIEEHRSKDAGYKEDASRVLDLTNMDLTFLSHMDQLVLMNYVNLSQNQVTALDDCNMLRCAQVLDASNNKLRRVTRRHALRLPSLQELSLSNNYIPDVKSLNCLQECHSLRKLDLRGNPCCESSGYREEIKALLPSLRELDGEPL